MDNIQWIECPRKGSMIGDGRWLATVSIGTKLLVTFATREHGIWSTDDGDEIEGEIIAIAYTPAPYRRPQAVSKAILDGLDMCVGGDR